jgi:predicted permease
MTRASVLRLSARRLQLRLPKTYFGSALLVGGAIGCVIAAASAIDVVWFRALPFPGEDRLVKIAELKRDDMEPYPTTLGNYREWRPEVASLESVGAYVPADPVLLDAADPRSLTVVRITASLLPTLGVRPVRGRAFLPGEEGGERRVAMLSHRSWVTEYGGRENVVGAAVTMDGSPCDIIGIAPPELDALLHADVITLLGVPTRGRGDRVTRVIGRLRPGATAAASEREMGEQVRALRDAAPENHPFEAAQVQHLRQALVGPLMRPVAGLGMLAAFLLAITVLNVVGLRLVEAERQQRITAVKLALGATRARLLRDSMARVSVAASIAAVTACVAGAWLLAAARQLARQALLVENLRLSITITSAGVATTLAVFLIAEAYPLWLTLRGNLARSLSHNLMTFRHGPARHSLRAGLVIIQTAVAVGFAVVSYNCVADVWRASHVAHGFDVANLWCVDIKTATGRTRSGGPSQGQEFVAIAHSLRSLPGVVATGLTNTFPATLEQGSVPLKLRESPVPASERTDLEIVTPGYFEALALPLREGRYFASADDRARPLVAIVNAAFRDRYWPGQISVGRGVGIATSPWFMITGEVGNVRSVVDGQQTKPKLYLCALQASSSGEATVVVRTQRAVTLAGRAVMARIRGVNPSLAVGPPRLASDVFGEFWRPRLFGTRCLLLLALVAIALALVGTYGLIVSVVSQRQREIAVRRTLGADDRWLAVRIVAGTAALSAVGLLAGLWLAAAAQPVYGTVVGVQLPWNPSSMGAVSAIVFMILGVSGLLPSWHAVRRPLLETLRCE